MLISRCAVLFEIGGYHARGRVCLLAFHLNIYICPFFIIWEVLLNGGKLRWISWGFCLFVFYVPSTARLFRDDTPIYCPLRRTWSSVFTPFPLGIEPGPSRGSPLHNRCATQAPLISWGADILVLYSLRNIILITDSACKD